jgi:hypothetical protein
MITHSNVTIIEDLNYSHPPLTITWIYSILFHIRKPSTSISWRNDAKETRNQLDHSSPKPEVNVHRRFIILFYNDKTPIQMVKLTVGICHVVDVSPKYSEL